MKKPTESGFLLVEILVAMSVIALALGALLQAFSHTVLNASAAQRSQLAALLAEQIIWEALWDEQLVAGAVSGAFENHPGVTWEREARLLYHPEKSAEEPAAPEKARGGREKPPDTDLYEVSARISWSEAGRPRQFELGTYVLVPVPETEELP